MTDMGDHDIFIHHYLSGIYDITGVSLNYMVHKDQPIRHEPVMDAEKLVSNDAPSTGDMMFQRFSEHLSYSQEHDHQHRYI